MEQLIQWCDSPYPALLFFAGAATSMSTLLAWNRRNALRAYPLVFLGAGAVIWQVAYGLAHFIEPGDLKITLAKVQYIGNATIPMA
jgi:hypothetical protein